VFPHDAIGEERVDEPRKAQRSEGADESSHGMRPNALYREVNAPEQQHPRHANPETSST
jgi:hypothetical protein